MGIRVGPMANDRELWVFGLLAARTVSVFALAYGVPGNFCHPLKSQFNSTQPILRRTFQQVG